MASDAGKIAGAELRENKKSSGGELSKNQKKKKRQKLSKLAKAVASQVLIHHVMIMSTSASFLFAVPLKTPTWKFTHHAYSNFGACLQTESYGTATTSLLSDAQHHQSAGISSLDTGEVYKPDSGACPSDQKVSRREAKRRRQAGAGYTGDSTAAGPSGEDGSICVSLDGSHASAMPRHQPSGHGYLPLPGSMLPPAGQWGGRAAAGASPLGQPVRAFSQSAAGVVPGGVPGGVPRGGPASGVPPSGGQGSGVCARDLSKMALLISAGLAAAAGPRGASAGRRGCGVGGGCEEGRDCGPGDANGPPAKRPRNAAVHGNYHRYYGYRLGSAMEEDPRLKVLILT